MILMLTDARTMSIDELKAFLASSDVLTFKGNSREETYAWIQRTLSSYGYLSRTRSEKGLIRSYMQKMTGMSAAKLTRLIRQFRCTRRVRVHTYKRHCFPSKYTREDQLLLAEVDEVHERLSGPATAAILKREYELFGKQQFHRLSDISVSHLYRLRHSSFYLNRTLIVRKTKPTPCQYGERRRPDPQGQPGYIRVDTVHQGDLNGRKGVYHVNTIDAGCLHPFQTQVS